MQGGQFAYDLLGYAIGNFVQNNLYLEYDPWEDGKEAFRLEAALFVKGW